MDGIFDRITGDDEIDLRLRPVARPVEDIEITTQAKLPRHVLFGQGAFGFLEDIGTLGFFRALWDNSSQKSNDFCVY